ncbi:MAG: flagellar hook-basal body complex protein FliE [Spirochaetota bacterium]
MAIFSANEVSGHVFELARTNPRHFAGRNEIGSLAPRAGRAGQSERMDTAASAFAGESDATRAASETSAAGSDFNRMLFDSLNEVNGYQQEHENLSVQSIINPDSVDPHDVTLAAAKANLSLSITKSVVDRVLQAYREITNLR